MSITRKLQILYLCYFSKPVSDRLLYKAIRRQKITRIVELGVGRGQRAAQMIKVARHCSPTAEIHYVGMDYFEGRVDWQGPGTSLKEVHQFLRSTKAKIQLVPGNPIDGLIRMANSLGKIDLLILPEEADSATAGRLWFFVPRMLHAKSLVFVDTKDTAGNRILVLKSRQEIDRLASAGQKRRAA